MEFFVPFDARNPKTRLSSELTPPERGEFARAMLRDVLDAIRGTGSLPEVISTGDIDVNVAVTVDERSLTTAVNDALESADRPVAILMADLPLATEKSVERFLASTGDLVIVPGLGGGTNGLLVREGEFRVDYHHGSFRRHYKRAEHSGLDVQTYDSFRLAMDVDRPADLAEVLLHSDGQAAEWLRNAGFELEDSESRTAVTRT